MSKRLQPSNLDEFIDLSEETRLTNSICPNQEKPIDNANLENLKHLEARQEIKNEENKKEIIEECKIEKKLAEDLQWFNEANTTRNGVLKSFERLNDKYEGEIKCGVPHGQGLYIFGDGLSYYKGGFECGKYNGYGVLHNHPGVHYVGNWHKNNRSNFGKQIYENGDTYEGYWNENKFNEYGVYYYKDGSYYNGNWSKGCKEGNGVLKWADGTNYGGTWSCNSMYKGIIYYPNGCRLEGEFWDGVIFKSKFFDANNTCFNGIYEDIYKKHLGDIDWHFKIESYFQIKENQRIREEEEKKIKIAEENKKIREEEEKKMIKITESNKKIEIAEKESPTIKWRDLFKCFRGKKSKKLD